MSFCDSIKIKQKKKNKEKHTHKLRMTAWHDKTVAERIEIEMHTLLQLANQKQTDQR